MTTAVVPSAIAPIAILTINVVPFAPVNGRSDYFLFSTVASQGASAAVFKL